MQEFAKMAQDFVEATSSLVRGRTINIMNLDGIIIASTEKERIGTFHQGAAEVIATGKTVLIEKEELSRYPGAKEGCNMPIFLEDQLIGVVGIFGCEEEVQDVANLLKVYVTQHFSQQLQEKKQNVENEMRSQLLGLLLLGDKEQAETISQLSGLISLKLVFPVQVIIIRKEQGEDSTEDLNRRAELIQNLLWKDALSRQKDVFGMQNNDYVILHGQRETAAQTGTSMKKIIEAVRREKGVRMAVSTACERLADIPNGMKEANALMDMNGGKICSMEDGQYQIQYLMYKSLLHGGSRLAEQLYKKLLCEADEKQAEILLTTALVYYQENGSVQKASEWLHIHKNTLCYRMKRLYEILGLEDETPFSREFFVRLVIIHHPVQLIGLTN